MTNLIQESINIAKKVDWSDLHFQGRPYQTLVCAHCNNEYRGHAKATRVDGEFMLIAKDGCPKCNGHGLKAAKTDVETWSIR